MTMTYNRVPRVTPDFWLIKLMAVTMGETAADYLAVNLGLGLTATSLIMVALLAVALISTTWMFALALAVTFALWFATERTLSIHAIFTARREGFYWLAILFTFALGTAGGDLVAEQFGLGYLATGILFGMIIASLAIGYFALGLDPVLGFWLAYIFTRPLGASFGDLLSQPAEYGGFGLGTIVTSALFLAVIGLTVLYMTVTQDGVE